MHDAGELVHGEEALLEVRRGLNLVGGNPVSMGDDAADVLFIHAFRRQELPYMMAVLLGGGILLIVHVVKPADGLPAILILAEIIRHGPHRGADTGSVYKQVVFGGMEGQKLLCAGES